MKLHRRCRLSLGLFLLSFVFVSAGNWPRFRGPDGAGQSAETSIPAVWTNNDYLWRVELPGLGHSSPLIWEDQVFVSSALDEDGTRIIRSLRKTDGSLLWEKRFPSPLYDLGNSTAYDTASPAVDRDRVYFTWASPRGHQTVALDRRNGDDVWQRNLGSFNGDHGLGASPVRFGDVLIVPNDQTGPSSIVALDCRTGATRWSVERRSVRTAYSTPTVYRPNDGTAQLILTSTAHGMSSFDPHTGKLNWELPDLFGAIRVAGSPVVADGLIFAQCGAGGAGKLMFAIRPPNPAKESSAEVAYELQGSLPYVPTPVAHGKWLFLWSDGGIVSCIDAPSGERIWRERVGGNFSGSPVRVGDRIYCISNEGEVVVLSAGPDFQLQGRIELEEPSRSTPAVADGVMYLRTFSHLMAIGGR